MCVCVCVCERERERCVCVCVKRMGKYIYYRFGEQCGGVMLG